MTWSWKMVGSIVFPLVGTILGAVCQALVGIDSYRTNESNDSEEEKEAE